MKKITSIILIALVVMLMSCTQKESAVGDSTKFIKDFTAVTTEYKNNPTKENLKVVIDLVKNTDIKLNDEEKQVLEQGMKEISQKVELSGEDVKLIWENNKDTVLGLLQDGTKNLIDKMKNWISSFSN